MFRYIRLKRLIDQIRGKDESFPEATAHLLRQILDLSNELGISDEDAVAKARSLILEPVTGETVYTSTVKFFTRKEDKNYGFLISPLKGDIHFHLNQGCIFECTGANEPENVGSESLFPLSGDKLLHNIVETRRGLTVSWWCFANKYQRALKEIQERPVVRLRDSVLNICRWEGKDLSMLRVLYPVTLSGDYWDKDRFVFERKSGTQWLQIADPR